MPALIVATAMFRSRSTLAYRAVRGASGSSPRRTGRGHRRHARAHVVHPRGSALTDCRGQCRLPAKRHRTVVLSGALLPTVDFLIGCDRNRPRLRRLPRLGRRHPVGTLFAFIGYLANSSIPCRTCPRFYSTYLSATAALDKIMDVLEEEPDVVDARDARPLSPSPSVRFEHVRFGYGDGPGDPRLDLDVPTGTTVALVNHGCRQSTSRSSSRASTTRARSDHHRRHRHQPGDAESLRS